jgi:hypothetical protein
VEEGQVKIFWNYLWKLSLVIFLLVGISWGTTLIGQHFNWDWGGFWSNFISNAGSSAVIGFVLYWIITRPDEKKVAQKRRVQALAMLKTEFQTDLARAKQYREALKTPQKDLTRLYPLRFMRGAWNALRESSFLPQIEDIGLIYELLRVNEVITVANSSLSTVRKLQGGKNTKTKLNKYAQKAVKECTQIEAYLTPILAKLDDMKLPEVKLTDVETDADISDDDDIVEDGS